MFLCCTITVIEGELQLLSVCLVVVVEKFDYVFPENGLVAYKDGKFLCKQVSGRVR